MKKAVYAIAGLGAVAALWAGGWYAGKTYVVGPEADRAVEQMRDGRVFFSFDRREIGGFPFGYAVSYTGVKLSDETALWSWRAPWATITPESGGAVLRPAPESRLTLSPGALGGVPDGAPTVFALKADDMTVRLSGDEGDGAAHVVAAGMTATQVGETETAAEFAFSASGLTGEVNFSAGSSAFAGEVKADVVSSYAVDASVLGGGRRDSRMTGFQLSYDADLVGARSLGGFLAGDGRAKAVMTASAFTGSTAGAAEAESSIASGPVEAELSIQGGRARYAFSLNAAVLEGVVGTMSPVLIPGESMSVGEMRMAMEMPLRRADGLAPYLLEMTLNALSPDDGLWSLFDPGGKLDHAPMNMTLAFGGDALVLSDFDAAAAGPPIDLETLELQAARLTALGVDAEATGAMRLDGPENILNGAVTLRVNGALALIDNLVAAGLLPPETGQAYAMTVLQYARQGAGEDDLVSEIVARDGAISVNGALIGR